MSPGRHPNPPTWLGELPDPADDAVARALADTLEHEADALEPNDRLAELRAATRVRRQRRPVLIAAAACGVLAVVVGGVAVALDGPDRGPTLPAVHDSRTTPARPDQPTPSASRTSGAPTRSTSSTSGGGQAVSYALPVYYVVQDGGQLRLAREWHRHTLDDPAKRMLTALQDAANPSEVLAGGLSAPWQPGSQSLDVRGPSDGVLTIDVPATEGDAHGRSADQARLAAQQLIWTATAVQQDASMGVRILVDGSPGLLFGSYPVGDVMHRDASVGPDGPQPSPTSEQPVSFIAIDLPRPQESLSAPVVVRGRACGFEAALSWELSDASGVVQSGHLTASRGCPDTGTWSVRLPDVPAGSYTFRAYALPASGQGDPIQDTVEFQVG
jgi:hypothetical protein